MARRHDLRYTFWEITGYAVLLIGILILLFMARFASLVDWLTAIGRTQALALSAISSSTLMAAGLILIRGGWKEGSVRARFVSETERLHQWKERRKTRRSQRRAIKKIKRANRKTRKRLRKRGVYSIGPSSP